jgi:N6-L-threonylcarbamoyladenine synthase
LAKREHGRNFVPILKTVLTINDQKLKARVIDKKLLAKIKIVLEREPELQTAFFDQVINWPVPKIYCLAVTSGPGLEPALWVGINFAKALSLLWDKPLLPINHLEGHLVSPLLNPNTKDKISFPAIGLVISGGHTEISLIKKWGDYQIIGQTRDDAAGEAFDKVARLLALPYPGGPEIAKLAEVGTSRPDIKLPRPMLHSNDLNFSFSGLKTAVLYLLPKLGTLTPDTKASVAKEFQTAVAEVLIHKTIEAATTYQAKTLIVGGGVIANQVIRAAFTKAARDLPLEPTLLLPNSSHTGDNATMIAVAAYLNLSAQGRSALGGKKLPSLASGQKITADGNLSLSK